MTRSLNEIEALSRKAARGAKMSWGLSEDAGRAVRWLAARGLPGPEALLQLLDRRDSGARVDAAPESYDDAWTPAEGATLCPILCGCLLSDSGALDRRDSLRIGPVAEPILLLPFASWSVEPHGLTVELVWTGGRATAGPKGAVTAEGDTLPSEPVDATLRSGPEVSEQTRAAGFRAKTSNDTVARLETYATRTYAPASEAGRLSGAGAGLSDND